MHYLLTFEPSTNLQGHMIKNLLPLAMAIQDNGQ